MSACLSRRTSKMSTPRIGRITMALLAAAVAGCSGSGGAVNGDAGLVADVDRGRKLQAESVEAYRDGDIARFQELASKALEARPNHPALVYNLSVAEAMLGRRDAALALLSRYAAFGLTIDAAADPDFALLVGDRRFEEIVAQLQANGRSVERSGTAFTIDDEGFFPEGIAYDPAQDVFFVGSLHQHRIVRVDGGSATEFARLGELSPLGLAIDAASGLLWAAGSGVEELGTQDVPARLLAYDARTGRLVHSFTGAAMLGDIAPDGYGGALASDPLHGLVWRTRGDRLEVVVRGLSSPQGIAVPPGDGYAYVADYALGIVRVDLTSGSTRLLEAPEQAMLLGIDGLVWTADGLIAIQNGATPARVLRLRLDARGHRIDDVELLEQAHADHDEPTNGVVADGAFYYVANGQWGRLPTPGETPPDVRAPVILRLPLQNE